MAGSHESPNPASSSTWDPLKRGFIDAKPDDSAESDLDNTLRAGVNKVQESEAKPAGNVKVGAGGWKYRFDDDGSITIVGAPAGHKTGAVLTGGAAYDAIKKEFGDVSRVTDPKKAAELQQGVRDTIDGRARTDGKYLDSPKKADELSASVAARGFKSGV